MGELEKCSLWCSPQRRVCERIAQLNSFSQVPPQFIFQSKSGSFYSEQPYHKCTFLYSQHLLPWRTRHWVLFMSSYQWHSSPSSAGQDKTWRNLHMKERRINTMQLQHLCELSECSACVLLYISYKQYHIWAKEVLIFTYPRE